MPELNFLATYQNATKRDYVARVTAFDKAACATVARQWGADYWDGARQYGYGGYHYDGRWRPIADAIARHYKLQAGDRVLDVGCGKAFLLYELTQAVPGLEVEGIDLSAYAIAHAKPEVQSHLQIGNATSLPFADHSVDLVLSLNTLHNLEIFDLATAVKEINRVGKKNKWICVESFRDEKQKVNLLYWQLTCLSFFTPTAWAYLLKEWGYDGDYGFIFFD
jgi:protein-L-isoaspartate(D-aspartate) O-methyltransferase